MLENWKKRDLVKKNKKIPEDRKGVCAKCKKEIDINIPYIADGMIGKKSEEHGCGSKYVQWTFILHIDELE